jgi:hypothetical protein
VSLTIHSRENTDKATLPLTGDYRQSDTTCKDTFSEPDTLLFGPDSIVSLPTAGPLPPPPPLLGVPTAGGILF